MKPGARGYARTCDVFVLRGGMAENPPFVGCRCSTVCRLQGVQNRYKSRIYVYIGEMS